MKTLALMASAALIGVSGAAYAQNAVGTGTNTGTDPASRSVSGVAGDTPTANSAAASAGTNNSAGATTGSDTTTTTTTTTPSADTSAAPATSDPTSAATSAPAADASGTSATQSEAASAPAATATSGGSATVQSQWATYDKDGNGGLNPLEFGTWILAAKGQDMSKQVAQTKTSKRANLPAIKVLNATAAEFSKADSDKDRAVSPAELTSYLGG